MGKSKARKYLRLIEVKGQTHAFTLEGIGQLIFNIYNMVCGQQGNKRGSLVSCSGRECALRSGKGARSDMPRGAILDVKRQQTGSLR